MAAVPSAECRVHAAKRQSQLKATMLKLEHPHAQSQYGVHDGEASFITVLLLLVCHLCLFSCDL